MNFIFFQPDEMRAESLGCYGHPVSKTPNFDAFAARATRFDQAHVSYTVCTQSRASFMTAWPTHVRGHRSLWSLLHPDEPNLLKYLKEAGYTVKWWGKNGVLCALAQPSLTQARPYEAASVPARRPAGARLVQFIGYIGTLLLGQRRVGGQRLRVRRGGLLLISLQGATRTCECVGRLP